MKLLNAGPVARAAASDSQTPDVLSVREVGGNNKGKWVMAYLKVVGLFEPAPWCCAFVCTRLVKAAAARGVKLPSWFPISGLCQSLVNAAKKQGTWIPVAEAQHSANRAATTDRPDLIPQRGDLLCFWFPKLGRIGHIGIVTASHTWGVESVEGNTGPETGGVNRDGDGVFEKKRDWSELGERGGFIRLSF